MASAPPRSMAAGHVAITLLPQDVAADAERLVRVQREARTLAALDHPGIYSSVRAGGSRWPGRYPGTAARRQGTTRLAGRFTPAAY